jgi:adenosylhomocysteine nucleosidase
MAMLNAKRAPILVVAALSYELRKLNSISHAGFVLLETGEGIQNAKLRLEAWLERNDARGVLSIGFAGGLSSSLQPGDIVVAREVRDSETRPDPTLLSAAQELRLGFPVRFGVAVTSSEIVWQSESKRALAASLGENEIGFVDMESTAIAGVCANRGLSFLIARSITDLLDEDLPLDFNLYRDQDGRVDSGKVMKAALRNPLLIKGLLELRRRSNLCADRMAEFVISLSETLDRAT